MKKFGVRLLLFILITGIPLYFISQYIDQNPYRFSKDKIPWILQHKNQHFDYGVGGSSRTENNLDVITMDSVLNTKGINLGYSGSEMAQIYLTLYLFLEKGNRLDYYLLQLDPTSLHSFDNSKTLGFHSYYFFSEMNDPIVSKVMKSHARALQFYAWKYIPFAKYAEYNSIYPIHSLLEKEDVQISLFDKNKGTSLLGISRKQSFAPNRMFPKLTLGIDSIKQDYLKAIMNLCNAKKIKLILYTCPYYLPYYKQLNKDAFLTLVNSDRSGYLDYIDFSSPYFASDPDLFYNETHMNSTGTLIFSKLLAERLKSSMN